MSGNTDDTVDLIDEPDVFDKTDVDSVEKALNSLWTQSHDHLGIGSSSGTSLSYSVNANVTVSVDTDWVIFDQFTLTNITLQAYMAKMSSSPAVVGISLTAEAQINEVNLSITAAMPRMVKGEDADLVLDVKVTSDLGSISPAEMITYFTNNGTDISAVTRNLDGPLGNQVDEDDADTGLVCVFQLVIQRNGSDGKYWLRHFSFSVEDFVHWPIIPGRLDVQNVFLGLGLSRTSQKDGFEVEASVRGRLLVANHAYLGVAGTLALARESKVTLTVSAETLSGATARDLIETVIDSKGADQAIGAVASPPSLVYPSDVDSAAFAAQLVLLRDKATQTWKVFSMAVHLELWGLPWQPVSGVPIWLEQIWFGLDMLRGVQNEWTYSGQAGGLLHLGGADFVAMIHYDSKEKITTVRGQILRDSMASLSQVAKDPLVNPSTPGVEHDLVAAATSSPAPLSSPIEMSMIEFDSSELDKHCTLEFSETGLTRMTLSLDFASEWNLGDRLLMADLGLYFSIEDPLAKMGSKPEIAGYIHGMVTLTNKVQLNAFVLGVSKANASVFRAVLSIEYDPRASLGQTPRDVLYDSSTFAFSNITSTGWVMPSSAPSDLSPEGALTSMEARLSVGVLQLPDPADSKRFVTSVTDVAVTLQSLSGWMVFEGLITAQVQLSCLVQPESADGKRPLTYLFLISGSVTSPATTVTTTRYALHVSAALRKAADSASMIEATVTATQSGNETSSAAPDHFLQMQAFGGYAYKPAGTPEASLVPIDYPTSPTQLMADAKASCSIKASQTAGETTFSLKEITFSLTADLSRPGKEWIIMADSLAVTQANLSLRMTNPRDRQKRVVTFIASATTRIGKAVPGKYTMVNATFIAHTAPSGSMLQVVVTSGGLKQILTTMLGSSTDYSNAIDGSPLTLDNAEFVANMILAKDSGTGAYRLKQFSVVMKTKLAWSLGPVTVTDLALSATYTDWDASHKASKFEFTGNALLGDLVCSVALVKETDGALSVTAVAGSISPNKLLLQTSSKEFKDFETPSLPEESGLESYQSGVAGGVRLVFPKMNNSWKLDQVHFMIVSRNTKWNIRGDYLTFTGLELGIQVKNIATSKTSLSAYLNASLEFLVLRGSGARQTITWRMEATLHELTGSAKLETCNLPQLAYTLTAGYLELSELCSGASWPSVLPDKITLVVNWDAGKGTLDAIYHDWALPSVLKHLLTMQHPTIHLDIHRALGSTWGGGELSGTAKVLGVPVTLSYTLPDGPFRVYGIDVKKAYELAKELYNAIKNFVGAAEEVAAICAELAELAELGEAAAVAAMVATALFACGVAMETISPAMHMYFPGQAWNTHTTEPPAIVSTDDPSSNIMSRSTDARPYLVVGGTAIATGPGHEKVWLSVYAKNADGTPLSTFVSSGLSIAVVDDQQKHSNITISWDHYLNGFVTGFARPEKDHGLVVTFAIGGGTVLSSSFAVTVSEKASALSTASTQLQCPTQPPDAVTYNAMIIPYDQYGKPRYGLDADQAFDVVWSSPNGQLPTQAIKITRRNDGYIIPFQWTSSDKLTLSVFAAKTNNHIAGSPFTYDLHPKPVSLGPEAAVCTASGPGVSNGVGGELTSFIIQLRSIDLKPVHDISLCRAVLAVTLLVETDTQQLAVAFADGSATVQYQRPPVGKGYSIEMKISGAHIHDSPFSLHSDGPPVSLSVPNSRLELMTMGEWGVQNYRSSSTIEAVLTCFGTDGNLFGSASDKDFAVRGGRDIVLRKLQDSAPNYLMLFLNPSSTGKFTFSVTASNDEKIHVQGSPVTVEILDNAVPWSVSFEDQNNNQDRHEAGYQGPIFYDQYGIELDNNTRYNTRFDAVTIKDHTRLLLQKNDSSVWTLPPLAPMALTDDDIYSIIKWSMPGWGGILNRVGVGFLRSSSLPPPTDFTVDGSYAVWENHDDWKTDSVVRIVSRSGGPYSGHRIYAGRYFDRPFSIKPSSGYAFPTWHKMVDNHDGTYSVIFKHANLTDKVGFDVITKDSDGKEYVIHTITTPVPPYVARLEVVAPDDIKLDQNAALELTVYDQSGKTDTEHDMWQWDGIVFPDLDLGEVSSVATCTFRRAFLGARTYRLEFKLDSSHFKAGPYLFTGTVNGRQISAEPTKFVVSA
ncbi:Putative immunoglobulin-like protein [Septoria linicola]|uniref:Immunoglobulin-like protein n=1 Tax=Septoria linicola TaxID=215465 RepID=A0A9Q9EHZ3_9PEZI|nr:putative immunoglobulin-like protein [Septoria linicola]USW50477.1 Putative immunoglobulin-like protein [Septoria linicola]